MLKWLGRSAAIPLLAQIARGELPCTHETLKISWRRSAAAFLHWLAERDLLLESCGQAHVDAWLAGERADRYIARSFARWATAQKLMPKLDLPAGRPHPSSSSVWPSSLSGCSTPQSCRLVIRSRVF